MFQNKTQSPTFWQRLKVEIENEEKWSRLTARNLDLCPNRQLDCLLAGFFEEPECHIRSRIIPSPAVIRQFFGKRRNVLLVWTDAVSVAQNDSILRMDYALLRVERNANDNPLMLTLANPESSFQVEFSNAEAVVRFMKLINQAFAYAKKRSLFSQNIITRHSIEHQTFFESRSRHGKYQFSPFHSNFPGCEYKGQWLDNLPHGKGTMSYPSGRQYRGRFVNGQFNGLGKSTITTLMNYMFRRTRNRKIDRRRHANSFCFKQLSNEQHLLSRIKEYNRSV
jgi:hypothetical protein